MFKKIIILFLFIILIGGGIFIIPKVVDWSNYQEKISTYFLESTGKQLAISGQVELTLLPTPKFIITHASMSNSEGFSQPLILEIPRAEIEIDSFSLISGKLVVKNITLFSPLLHLERKTDGTGNWDFKMLSVIRKDADLIGIENNPMIATDEDASSRMITTTIHNGKITYKEGETAVTLENADIIVKTVNANGPYKLNGTFSALDFFYTIDVTTGEIFRNAPVSTNLVVSQRESGTKMTFTGSLDNILGTPAIKGAAILEAAKVGGLYQIFTGETLDRQTDDSFALTFDIEKNSKMLNLANTIFNYGTNRGSLTLKASFEGGKTIKAEGTVAITNLDIDALGPTLARFNFKRFLDIPEAEIKFVGDAITYKKQKFTENKATVITEKNKIIIKDFHSTIQDGTEVEASLSVNRSRNNHTDGWVNVKSTNAPAIAEWYLGKKIMFAPNTFKIIDIKTEVSGPITNLSFKNLTLQVDNITASGAASLNTENDRPSVAVTGRINAINLDNYLKDIVQIPSFDTTRERLVYIINHLNPFPGIDIKTDLFFDFVSYRTFPYTKAQLSLATEGNNVTISEISGDFGGINTNINGQILEVGTNDPKLKDLILNFSSINPGYSRLEGILTYLGVASPIAYKDMTNLTSKTKLNGTLDELMIESSIKTAVATLSIFGKYEYQKPLFEGDFDLRHNNLKKLLADFGVDYNSSKPLGITKITGNIKKSPVGFSITGLDLSVGAEKISGTLAYNKVGERPALNAKLHTNFITLSDYLPQEEIHLWSRDYNKLRPLWNKEPLNITLFNNVDASIEFAFDSLAYDGMLLTRGEGIFLAHRNKLSLDIQKAKFLDGDFTIKSEIDISLSPYPFTIEGKISGAKIAQPVFRADALDIIEGTAFMDYDFKSSGKSIDDLILGLNGHLNFKLERPYIKGANFNMLASLVTDTYENKKAITEKDFSEYVDLYLRQGVTNSPEISGTVVVDKGVVSISTQPFEITKDAFSRFEAEIKISSWDISAKWDLKVLNNEKLSFLVGIEGALDAPRRNTKSEEAKQFILSAISEYTQESKTRSEDIGKDFSGILSQLQLIMPKIREAEQQTRQVTESDPELQHHYNEIAALTKSIGIEVRKIKALYELKNKTEQDLQNARVAFANVESHFDNIQKEMQTAIKERAKIRVEKITKRITEAEAQAKAFFDNDKEVKEIYEEIHRAAETAKKAAALAGRITNLQDANALEEKLSASWDRVNYLINYLKGTARGQLSGNSTSFREDSYESKLPAPPGIGSTMTKVK